MTATTSTVRIRLNRSFTRLSLRLAATTALFALAVAPLSLEAVIRPSDAAIFRVSTGRQEIKIMTYNVLNLFDAEHDDGHADFEMLPANHPLKREGCISSPPRPTTSQTTRQRVQNSDNPQVERCLRTDWTRPKVMAKVEALARAISLAGDLPDILALQEIENENVARLMTMALGYTGFTITKSPDRRGIDVALLYRTDKLTPIGRATFRVEDPAAPNQRTRDLLRVDFEVKNAAKDRLIFFVNHWPSQASPTERRIFVANLLKTQIDRARLQHGQDVAIVALGDFNSTPDDRPIHPVVDVLQSRTWAGALRDAADLAREARNPALRFMPPEDGTHYFVKGQRWTKLDRILVSRSLNDGRGLELVGESFRVLAALAIMQPLTIQTPRGPTQVIVPKISNLDATRVEDQGFSDHLPVYVKLRF